jgi:predicted molibdopterin-dependent oxidoreductase YjgC
MSLIQLAQLNQFNLTNYALKTSAAAAFYVSRNFTKLSNSKLQKGGKLSFRGCLSPGFHLKASGIHTTSLSKFAVPDPSLAANKTIRMKINGREIDVKEGTNIADAASDNGFFIPTLCYHPRLPAAGNCRVCLVEVVGSWKMVPACTTTAQEGMQVNTDSVQVKENTTNMLQLLRANHPNDCMTCSSNAKCEFQDLIYQYDVPNVVPDGVKTGGTHIAHGHLFGTSASQAEAQNCPEELDISSDAIQRAMDKCIRCGRCVRACSVIQDQNILGFVNRGGEEHVSTTFGQPLDMTLCIECGQCAAYWLVASNYSVANNTSVQLVQSQKDQR